MNSSLLDRLLNTIRTGYYLPVFRLYICFHLVKRIILYWPSLDTLYSSKSFVAIGDDLTLTLLGLNVSFIRDHYQFVIFIYLALILCYAFGVGKNLTALALFFFFYLMQRLNHQVLNGGDNIMFFIMLYMVFADSYQRFSITPLQLSGYARRLANLFTNLAVYSIMIHLCFAYFFSAVGKTNADEWYNGIAVYYIFSSERFMGTYLNEMLAKNGYFVTLATYFTLLFEFSFPFLIWFRNMRPLLIISGIGLHLGIYIFMMIHDFQFVFLMTYAFFYTDDELKAFYEKVKLKWVYIRSIGLPLLNRQTHQ